MSEHSSAAADGGTVSPGHVVITAGPFRFVARLEEQAAPRTCAAFREMLPFESRVIHARWSGEACWVPMGEMNLPIPEENALNRPQPGQLLFYPGGPSETEILIPYGVAAFAAVVGPLSGNHFLTVVQGGDRLPELGRMCLWEGAQPLRVELAEQ